MDSSLANQEDISYSKVEDDQNLDVNEETHRMNLLDGSIFGNDLILSKIFLHLTLRELSYLSNVSSQWHQISRNVINLRHSLCHIFQLFRINKNSHQRRTSRETHLGSDDLPFISKSFDQMEMNICKELKEKMFSRPQLALLLHGSFCPHSRRTDKLLKFDSSRKFFPPSCKILNICSSAGLIGCPLVNNSLTPIETQGHYSNVAGVSYVLFPSFNNCDITIFDEDDDLEVLTSGKDLKCLLIFATTCYNTKNEFKSFPNVDKVTKRFGNQLAIGGMIVDDIAFFPPPNLPSNQESKRTKSMFGIALSGEKVKAASLIYQTQSIKDTEEKFMQFRRNIETEFDLKSGSCSRTRFAMIFICAGRGYSTYNSPNIEANAFAKIFPGIQLFGIFGQGEFGHDFWPGISEKQQEESKFVEEIDMIEDSDEFEGEINVGKSKIDYNLWHFYTSVLVIVDINN